MTVSEVKISCLSEVEMSEDWADEVAEAPPTELAPVLPELPQIMLFGERQSVTFVCKHNSCPKMAQ